MTKSFADLDGDTRMSALKALESIGAQSCGYTPSGIILCLSRDHDWSALLDWASKLGMQFKDGSMNYFPLGSDKPSEPYRHDGPKHYGASKAFWLYCQFEFPRVSA